MSYKYNGEKIKFLLKKNQLVKVDTDERTDVILGETLEFINYDIWAGGYVFKNSKGERIIFSEDKYFVTLPSKEEIKSLIDVVLTLGDKKWFDDLVYTLNNEI